MKKPLTEKERKVRAVLLRPRLRFEPKSPERQAAMQLAHEKSRLARLRPGDKMKDGTIFIGISPITHRPFYAAMQDQRLMGTYNRAITSCSSYRAHEQQDWRLPALEELQIIFNNRAAIQGCDGWGYWSGTSHAGDFNYAAALRFRDGHVEWIPKQYAVLPIRYVRG